MRFFDWLIGRVPGPTEPAPEITPTADAISHGITVIVGDDDLASEIVSAPDPIPVVAPVTAEPTGQAVGKTRYILEPYFAMIEYTDTNGVLSRRRITMRSVDDEGGVRYLNAVCHERKALRTFRLDRVSCLISQDGEVEDPGPWFAEILETADIEKFPAKPVKQREPKNPEVNTGSPVSAYTALRREITPAMTLLLAVARSDDLLHEREMDRILRYAEDEAVSLRNSGHLRAMPEAEEFDKLERTIRRLRPTREDVIGALTIVDTWSKDRKTCLAKALADTAGADGKVDEIEAELIDEFRTLGARHYGYGWDG